MSRTAPWNLGIVLQKDKRALRSLAPSIIWPGGYVSKKSIRILIADAQHFNRLRIERWFNQLGYYRIAPVQDLQELLVLVEYDRQPFDLLMINAAFGNGHFDLLDYCRDNRQRDRVMIYDGHQAQLPAIPVSDRQNIHISHALMPDLALIRQLTACADPLRSSVISVG